MFNMSRKRNTFEEVLAKTILSNMTHNRYSQLYLGDKPDLYDSDFNIGIEVSQTAFCNNTKREKQFRHLLCQCKGEDDQKTINTLRHLLCEQYDYTKNTILAVDILDLTHDWGVLKPGQWPNRIKDVINSADYWTLWKLQCLFDHNTEGIIPAINNKRTKIKNYEKFDIYDLFLFSDDLYTKERLDNVADSVYINCKNTFRFVYLNVSSSTSIFSNNPRMGFCLVIFNIDDESYEQLFYDKQEYHLLCEKAANEFQHYN